MKHHWLTLASATLVSICAGCATNTADVPRVEYSPHGAHIGCRVNLGPTGATAWMRGYQFEVVTVDPGSPADGILHVGDRIVAVADTQLADPMDSRMILGDAIGKAEAEDGRLILGVTRSGKGISVTVPLAPMGDYAPTWPYACEKSQRILYEACVYLREAQFPEGVVVTDGGMGTYLSGLAFLASEDPRFLDAARRAVYAVLEIEFEKLETHNWGIGYGCVLMAEYFLRTGDGIVLPRLKELMDHLAEYQMQCGSWGHNSPNGAYGALNQPGIVCAMAMSLAQECGVEIDEGALNRALNFYGQYAELGSVPYGDHPPGATRMDDNGKSASASVLLSWHPAWRAASDVFADSIAMSYWTRETGHTGGFFSMLWGPLAAHRAGVDAFRSFMDYQDWYYNLSRTWRGELMMLPYYEAMTRFDNSSYVEFGGEFTTGGLALTYAIPQQNLRILGAPRSIFSAQVTGALADARACVQEQRWQDLDAALAAAEKSVSGADEKRWLQDLKDLRAYLDASTQRTVTEIENALSEDGYRASEQFKALQNAIGAEDPRLAELTPRFEEGVVKWHVGAGERYYEAWRNARSYAFQTWLPYAKTAQPLLGEVPPLRPALWTNLLPVSEQAPAEWGAVTNANRSMYGERSFTLETCDYTHLRVHVRSPRNAHTHVSLNGSPVAELTRGQRGGHAKIPLNNAAVALLRVGENTLSIHSTDTGVDRNGNAGGNSIDMGLYGVERELPLPPIDARPEGQSDMPAVLRETLERARMSYASQELSHTPRPGVPERLRVRDTMDRFGMALRAACDALTFEELDVALRSPVAYWRHQAAMSLTRRGGEGQARAALGLSDRDWRVRSASCDAVGSIAHHARRAKEPVPFDAEARATLHALLSDDNAWVRVRAAGAVSAIAEPDAKIAAQFAKLSSDPNAWVRNTALRALPNLTEDAALMREAIRAALHVPSSSYGVARRALRLLKDERNPKGKVEWDASLVPGLIFAIENPGQGMGSHALGTFLKKLVELDPEGEKTVPTLMKVAEGGRAYDRLQGGPRKVAIQLLGELGPGADAASGMLQGIAESEDDRDKGVRAAAQEAWEQVTGTAGDTAEDTAEAEAE